MDIFILYILCLATGLIAGYRLKLFKLKSVLPHGISGKYPGKEASLELMTDCMKSIQVVPQVHEKENGWQMEFQYQTGNFSLFFSEDTKETYYLIYPFIAAYPLSYLELVRTMCNKLNSTDSVTRLLYVLQGEENRIVVHIDQHTPNTTQKAVTTDFLKQGLEAAFATQRQFLNIMDQAIEHTDGELPNDVEYSRASQSRIENLLLEQFSLSTPDDDCGHLSTEKVPEMTLQEWLGIMGLLQTAEIERMLVVKGNMTVQTLDSQEEINSFKLVDALKGTDGEEACHHATIRIDYKQFKQEGKPAKSYCATLAFSFLKSYENADYYQLSYLISADNSLNEPASNLTDAQSKPLCGCMTFSLNKTAEQKLQAEYVYIINDAMDKVESGKTNELSEEERTLVNLFIPEAQFFTYWGQRYLQNACYAQALLMLRRAWVIENKRYYDMKKAERHVYYELNYWMAGCLYKLGLFKEALYYLGLLENQGHINYAKLHIKCLRAMHDPRTIQFLSRVEHDVDENIENFSANEEKVPGTLLDFKKYVRREQVKTLIEVGAYPVAEPICKQMIKEQTDAAFAQEQIRLIEKLKQELIDGLHTDDTGGNTLSAEHSDQPDQPKRNL